MTVILSVHDVREHIRRASKPSIGSPVQPSSSLLGRIFHEVAVDLVRPDPLRNAFSFLEALDFDKEVWRSRLALHTYDILLGPRLTRDEARLQEAAAGVLHLWEAVQSFCRWLVDLAWAARNPEGRKKALSWNDLREALQGEVPLESEFFAPGWSEPVRLTGIADSLLRLPRSGKWCVQEYKLGRTSPEADLSQVCLYHLILTQKKGNRKGARGSGFKRMLALISFQPEMKERLFSEDEIISAKEKLLALIGRLAGVAHKAPSQGSGQFSVFSVQGGGGGTDKLVCPWRREPQQERSCRTADSQGRKLTEVFREYGRPVELAGEPVIGPAFFRFHINPGRGVKLDQVQRLGREIQVRLGLSKPPFIGVDRGRAVVDIERPDRQIIRFADVGDQLPVGDPLTGSALVPIGMDLNTRLRTADLNEPVNAHLLVAGTTGSGKTEWLRVAIQGLIHSNTTRTLRLLLIDPKRTAFNEFADSPYLLTPESLVFPDAQPVGDVLKELVKEMERRYVLFQEAGVSSLNEYLVSTRRLVPRIVCVCDEYYALIAGDSKKRKEIEAQISLLGAKARAAGIHLILATQQPSREVIKGALDSNIPARVGLMMVKKEESKMLLGQNGAENLLGKGDLLFKDVGDPLRLQALFLGT
jgi:S-DNA-T family DNA segregation ATPase FtsK/SpoIIIE